MGTNYEEIIICRLCLTIINKQSDAIDNNITREAIDILLLKLNFKSSEHPIICEECLKNIHTSIDFKSVCVDTEELLTCFADDRKITRFEIKDIYEDDEDKERDIKKDFSICRFCINPTDLNNLTPLKTLMEEITFKDMLLEYMPEMDFNIIKNPVICSTCRDHLESYFKLIWICVDVEDKIKTYCQEVGSDSSELKLDNVRLHFLCKGTLKHFDNNSQICTTRQESTTIEYTENVHSKAYGKPIKVEDLDIKDEGSIFIVSTNGTLLESGSVQHRSMLPNIDEGTTSNVNFLETGNDMPDPCTEMLVKRTVCNKQKKGFRSHEVNRHRCKLCTFKTKLQQALKVHMKIHRGTLKAKRKSSISNALVIEMFKCALCTYKAKQKSQLKTHMLIHKDVSEIIFKCSVCIYETKQKHLFKKHMLIHKDVSEIEMFKCSLCTYEAKQKYSLKTHMIIHQDISEINMFKCSVCTYEAKRKDGLKKHMLIHKDISEIEIFKCALCNYEAKNKMTLKTHMLIHKDVSEIEMFKCALCNYEAKHKSNLKTHMLIHKDVSETDMFKCSACTYVTKRKNSLEEHMLIHKDVSEIEMFKCSLCTYEAKQKYSLKIHMLIHKDVSEINMFKCSVCAYEAKRKYGLKKHMLIHKDASEIEMFKCALCNYEAKQKSNLKTHIMLIHKDVSEIDMFKCLVCTYVTKRKISLEKHMLIHKDVSEIEIFKCALCTYGAKQKCHLKTHIMLIHKDVSEIDMFKCSVCTYEAKLKSHLKSHMRIHKNVLKKNVQAFIKSSHKKNHQVYSHNVLQLQYL